MAIPKVSAPRSVQNLIHAIEQGNLAFFVRAFLVLVLIVGVALIYLGWRFRGFAIPEAMDQAQVSREIAQGHGWSTRFIRPLALWQIENNGLALPKEDFPDTFNAPLPPLVNSLAVRLSGSKMEFKQGEYIAPAERFIVVLSMLCFLGAVGIEYFLLRRLFDGRLAFWAATLTLVSDLCWQFTLSGLPQMLMLLIFNAALYALVRAIEAHAAVERGAAEPAVEGEAAAAPPGVGPVLAWLAATGVLFGLLALSHALAVWHFVGALGFAAVYFRRRTAAVVVLLLAFALVYAPWLVHTYRVSGNAFGVAGYTFYDGVGGSTTTRMRSTDGPLLENTSPLYLRTKLEDGIVTQFGQVANNLGDNFLALGFFVCLLHSFRRPEVNALQWAVLMMWGCAVVGAALLGNNANPASAVNPNELIVLFLPVMLGFGLAFALVLFSRRTESANALVRMGLFTVLFVISALPLIFTILPRNLPPVQYPPYYEPALNRVGQWTRDNEIVGSDMPWAIAWYADRKSLWIPNKFHDFMALSDDGKLPGSLAGMFLTPLSRNAPLFTGVLKGEYQDYQGLILGRAGDIPLFPFQQTLPLMDVGGYLFFSDTRRWEHEQAAP